MEYNFEYDREVEITKKQYDIVIKLFEQIIAHRVETPCGVKKKYYIKLWGMRYKAQLVAELKRAE